jgi:hypothetical protein
MKLSEKITIGEVRAQFRRDFPYLEIEFYFPAADRCEEGVARRISGDEVPLGLVRCKHINGYIRVDPGLSAAALEKTFQEIFGLTVRIFRRSAGARAEAGKCEGGSLLEENLRGMNSSQRALIM